MIYAVSPFAQKAEVDAYCFGECMQILIGGLGFCGGSFCPCRTTPCPYEDKSISMGKAKFEWGWEEVIVRRLKKLPQRQELPERGADATCPA